MRGILEMEFIAMKKGICNINPIAGVSIVTSMILCSEHTGHQFHYTRVLEYGRCSGLSNRCLVKLNDSATLVTERVLTAEDIQLLRCTDFLIKNKTNYVAEITKCWTTLCALPLPFGFLSWLVLHDGTEFRMRCEGIDQNVISSHCQQLQETPDSSLWTVQRLLQTSEATTLPLTTQLDLINCIPNVWPSKYARDYRDALYMKWCMQSMRYQAIMRVDCSAYFGQLTKTVLKSNPKKKRKFNRVIVGQKSTNFDQKQTELDAACTTESTFNFISNQPSLTTKFSKDIVQFGLLRVLSCEHQSLRIVWNSTNPIDGSLMQESFSISEAILDQTGPIRDFSCDNCQTFADSLRDFHFIQQGGLCVHKRLIGTVWKVLSATEEENLLWTTNDFNFFVRQQMSMKLGCKLLEKSPTILKFFVLIDSQSAIRQRTTEVSVCFIQKIDKSLWVKCNEMRCNKGKLKNLKKTNSVQDVCAHLLLLFHDAECQQFLNKMGMKVFLQESNVNINGQDSVLSGDDSENSSDHASEEEDHEDVGFVSSVRFDTTRRCWEPVLQGSQKPIPFEPDDKTRLFALIRKSGKGLLRDENDMFIVNEGCFDGEPCIAQQSFCDKCGGNLESTHIGVFYLRTNMGCIRRQRFVLICACGATFHWDPTVECIHVIKNGTEGGEASVCISCKPLCLCDILV